MIIVIVEKGYLSKRNIYVFLPSKTSEHVKKKEKLDGDYVSWHNFIFFINCCSNADSPLMCKQQPGGTSLPVKAS